MLTSAAAGSARQPDGPLPMPGHTVNNCRPAANGRSLPVDSRACARQRDRDGRVITVGSTPEWAPYVLCGDCWQVSVNGEVPLDVGDPALSAMDSHHRHCRTWHASCSFTLLEGSLTNHISPEHQSSLTSTNGSRLECRREMPTSTSQPAAHTPAHHSGGHATRGHHGDRWPPLPRAPARALCAPCEKAAAPAWPQRHHQPDGGDAVIPERQFLNTVVPAERGCALAVVPCRHRGCVAVAQKRAAPSREATPLRHVRHTA